MNEYDFTLKFRLQPPDVETKTVQLDPNHYIEQLYESGCDDALIGVGKQGLISLNFNREAQSAYAAIASAISDVKQAIPSAKLIEASPDFVGLTDVAKVLGCTRQNVRNLIINGVPKSPLPVYEGTPSLWHLADLLLWLQTDKTYEIDNVLLETAQMTMKLNAAKSWQRVGSELQEDIKYLVA
ncbi:DNA-binding protein [Acaryochloris sp. IP29b_bin.137]|uniref:DNA-binding protein n=1 Tax=Acaryochloris sp. IP29b_bin.137 TaxID=2969217 RepID=UPI002618F2E5|nr:DNA-binding protein [Acaryochloris sp. IP29b_bin.137]